MNTKISLLGALAFAALSLATTAAATAKHEAEQLARYEAFAKPPVDEMPFWQMQGYENLGKDALMVWTNVKDAWLIRVYEPCVDLPWANSVGLTSNMRRVTSKFDFVLVRQSRCKIKTIQPVDYRAYLAEQRRSKVDPAK